MVTESFFIMLVSSVTTVILALFGIMYKSKCTHIQLCGLSIDRDVQGEEKLDASRSNESKV